MATQKCNTLNVTKRDVSGYLPIENYGMIGNMRTCALVSMDGSVGMHVMDMVLHETSLTLCYHRFHVLVSLNARTASADWILPGPYCSSI